MAGSEREGGLSAERVAYLEGRITQMFVDLTCRELFLEEVTMDKIDSILEEKMSKLFKEQPEIYPDGASKEDALARLLVYVQGFNASDEVLAFGLLWGERFGAGEFDPSERVDHFVRDVKIR